MILSWTKGIFWTFLSKIFIRPARARDIPDMVYMDTKRYPPKWCVDEEWAREIMFSDCAEYYVHRRMGRVIAYYAFIHVTQEAYMKLLYNRMPEDMLVLHLWENGGYTYIHSINSLPNTPKFATKLLLTHVNKRINELRELQHQFVSIAISEDGKRVLDKLGLRPLYVDRQDDVVVFSS